tara:strand:+ start:7639 stop:8328 length:690 start_codon:yes stop_codon:yes gene_type:complete
MPKKTKAEDVPTPVAPVAKEVAPKKKAAAPKKKPPPKESTPAPAPAPASVEVAKTPEPTTETSEQTKEVSGLTEDFGLFLTHFQQATQTLNGLKNEFRALEKKAMREIRQAQKLCARRKRKTGNRSPSGFVKPTKISNELASFLGKEAGTEMARTDVTREINAYIRANKLQDPQNGRKINADTNLSSLLKLQPSDELTYFNLQKYMSPHFQKQADKLALEALENQKISA